MPDYFALLSEPRRPWLDSEALKAKFLGLSAEVHPDRVHAEGEESKRQAQNRYTELNAAYNCLKEPVERLRHLLELELGTRPKDVQEIPNDLAGLFMETSMLCREAGTFVAEKQKVSSPLLKVQWFERGEQFRDRLVSLQQKIRVGQEALLAETMEIDSSWDAGDRDGQKRRLTRLEEIYRLLSYFTRWSRQIQELMVQISL